ncbi:Pentatricopeptide repeat (PPR) superfamily protein [Thalictrum thalictroides]|uniref:Pentatricopeptide repeat (PPR) superfamily protein n=1 Tax=Thalictrum thalictroides TaxID=46969 RepID=A0A7J6WW15_THATH|nr:Pentatricopeptide repeat (PPR) superfamily protein [Thalictrum thalictroides]
MEELGVRPNDSIVVMVGDVFIKLGMLDKYEKLKNKYPPAKWEYRYYKGKRCKVLAKQASSFEETEKHMDSLIEEQELLSDLDEEVNTDKTNRENKKRRAIEKKS